MNTTKRFDRELYNQADAAAKNAIVAWLETNNFVNIETKETMSFDLVCNKLKHNSSKEEHAKILEDSNNETNEPKKYFFEVEIKYAWKGEWPDDWKEIRIPYRKQKLIDRWLKEFPGDALTFVIFRNDCEMAWYITGDDVSNSEVKEVSNRNVSQGEKFFHINVENAELVNMK